MILHLENRLFSRKQLGNLRHLSLAQDLIDFSSNDFLGLARSKDLSEAFIQEGLGSTGSRLLTGNSLYAQTLEDQIAAFHGFEAGLLFNCGYMANIGLISAIAGAEDAIFFDEAVHASTRDGIRLSQAKAFPFRHNDLDHLENRLKNSSAQGNRLICIASIYSTDGSTAPLTEIYQLAKRYEAELIVDEAHAVGACGPSGKGLVAKPIFAKVVTFGKALGTFGAIILGSHTLKETLINFATPYIYTTALPFYALAAIKCSYELFPKMDAERRQLQKLIHLFRASSTTHIQSIPIRGNNAVREVSQKLRSRGFDVRPLMSPTVQRGHEALRICLHAFNTEEQLSNLLEVIHG